MSVETLLPLLESDVDGIRSLGLEGLSFSLDPRARNAVLTVGRKEKDKNGLWTAFEVLARLNDPRATEVILNRAQDELPARKIDQENAIYMRGEIYCQLSQLTDPRATEAVVKMLQDDSAIQKILFNLSRLNARNPLIADALAARLDHNQLDIRTTAIHALACAGDYRAIEPLVFNITHGQSSSGEVEWLSMIRDSRAEEALLTLGKRKNELWSNNSAENPFSPKGKYRLKVDWLQALIQTRDPGVFDALFETI